MQHQVFPGHGTTYGRAVAMGGLASLQNSVPLVARGGQFALRWLCNMPVYYSGTCMRDVLRSASARVSCGCATACPVCPLWRRRGHPVADGHRCGFDTALLILKIVWDFASCGPEKAPTNIETRLGGLLS
jgi:hypothetical protein